MNRTKQMTAAALLLFAYSAVNLMIDVPYLARGTATGPDEAPFFMTLIAFVLDLSGIFAAFGLWQNAKWGKVLAVVIQSLQILYSLVPLLVAPPIDQVVAGIGIVWSLVILVLIFWRSPRPAPAQA